MDKIDFSTYKFRCSFLPTLMTNSRSKVDILSETAKTALRELWIKEVYGREKFDTTNKYTEKGILCEADAFDLIKKVKRKIYFKNKNEFSNEFIKGTPDIWDEAKKLIVDTKCSWSIWSFNNADEDYAHKSYFWQMMGYMWLTGSTKAELLFCLVNTPEEIMNDELFKLQYKFPEINESDEKAERFKKNYIFDDIPAKLRVKSFMTEYNEVQLDILKERIEAARAYLATIEL